MDTIRADFDRIARLEDSDWNHNNNYHTFLLRQLPSRIGEALDVGCGQGDFARLLAERADHVLAVDLSPEMIRVAQEKSIQQRNIEYQLADVMRWAWPRSRFDCIASLTTLRHLLLEQILADMKMALKPGGKLLVLDLYQSKGITPGDALAFSLSAILRLLKNGRLRESAEARAAWDAHGKHDHYLPLSEIRTICASVLPGATVTKHLFWRYSIIWQKPV